MYIPSTFGQPLKVLYFNVAWTYIAGLLTGNLSQVDRVWTFLPVLYTAYYTAYPLLDSADPFIKRDGVRPRVALMLALQVVWMIRLSYNTWRRDLFKLSEEDYRWPVFRKMVPPWLLQVFNLVFVAGVQNVILFLLGLPAHNALVEGPYNLQLSDYILALSALVVLAIEFTSDNQQWAYQNFKKKGVLNPNEWPGARLQWTEDDRKRGFVTRGLWSISRHPNCASEQTFWYIMTLFPICTSPNLSKFMESETWLLWKLIPALVLSALFYSSTRFTESISASKYPDYAAYQWRVDMFWPTMTAMRRVLLTVTGKREQMDKALWGPTKGKRAE